MTTAFPSVIRTHCVEFGLFLFGLDWRTYINNSLSYILAAKLQLAQNVASRRLKADTLNASSTCVKILDK